MRQIEFILYVADSSKSKEFYRQLLALEPTIGAVGMTEFCLAEKVKLGLMPEGCIMDLLAPKMPHPKQGNGIPRCALYLKVNNVQAYMKRGVELGATLVDALQQREWGDWVGYLADLDGHIIAFAEADPDKYKERLIKKLKNGRSVIFDKGSFDDWCVFVVEKDGQRKAPFDVDYFTDMQAMAKHYQQDKVYNDFVAIYAWTDKTIDQQVITMIDKMVTTYQPDDQILIEQWMTVLYAGMIAEENKEFAILKKRIKRLGMHQILKLGYTPEVAANFSKGKKWRVLDAIMVPLGF